MATAGEAVEASRAGTAGCSIAAPLQAPTRLCMRPSRRSKRELAYACPFSKSLASAFTLPQAATAQPAAFCRPLRIQVESRSPRCAPVIFLPRNCYYLNSCLRMSIGGLKAFYTARTDYRACGPTAAGRAPPVQRPPHCTAGAPTECVPHRAARPAALPPGCCGGLRQNDGR